MYMQPVAVPLNRSLSLTWLGWLHSAYPTSPGSTEEYRQAHPTSASP